MVALGAAGCFSDGEAVGTQRGSLDGPSSVAAACDLSKPFESPRVVVGLDDRDIFSARLSADETSAVIAAKNGATGTDLLVATRATAADPFVIGAPIAELDSSADEYWPSLSADGETIFFESGRHLSGGGTGNEMARIWMATRSSGTGTFGTPIVLGAFQVGKPEGAPYFHPGGHALYFTSLARGGAGNLDLFVADLTDFGVVTGVRPIKSANGPGVDHMPLPSYDERALFFARADEGLDDDNRNIWVVGRASSDDEFGIPQAVVELNSTYDEFPSSLSTDACRIYFVSNRPDGGVQRYRIWVASKPL